MNKTVQILRKGNFYDQFVGVKEICKLGIFSPTDYSVPIFSCEFGIPTSHTRYLPGNCDVIFLK